MQVVQYGQSLKVCFASRFYKYSGNKLREFFWSVKITTFCGLLRVLATIRFVALVSRAERAKKILNWKAAHKETPTLHFTWNKISVSRDPNEKSRLKEVLRCLLFKKPDWVLFVQKKITDFNLKGENQNISLYFFPFFKGMKGFFFWPRNCLLIKMFLVIFFVYNYYGNISYHGDSA